MARSRNIKPSFFTNDELAELDPLARLLFIGLWTIADREGRLEDRPKRIKAEILPYDDCDIDACLKNLSNKSFVVRYEVNGERYIQICNFKKHQNPHIKENPSVIPVPDLHQTSTVQEPNENGTIPADSLLLIPDSFNLIPDSLKPIYREFGKNINRYSENEKMVEAIVDFIKMRKSIKKPMTERAVELMLAKLDKLANDDETKIEILNRSIMNSWQGIFPLDTNTKRSSQESRLDMINRLAGG